MVSIYNSGRNRYWGPDGNPFAKESKKSIKQEQTFLDNSHRVASIAAARSLAPMLLTDTSEATSSSAYIAELARALRYDVDLIYEWVYSNVDFYPVWGAYKGALGTLIDKTATPFDQCALMVALLRESRHTANFVKGSIS